MVFAAEDRSLPLCVRSRLVIYEVSPVPVMRAVWIRLEADDVVPVGINKGEDLGTHALIDGDELKVTGIGIAVMTVGRIAVGAGTRRRVGHRSTPSSNAEDSHRGHADT